MGAASIVRFYALCGGDTASRDGVERRNDVPVLGFR